MKKIKKNKIYLIGIFLIIIGIVFYIIPAFLSYISAKNEKEDILEYLEQDFSYEETGGSTEEISTYQNEDKNIAMVLDIPKINLKKGLYSINSKYNAVKYNVEILKESNMPNIENGNLVLAAHNGSSRVSFFRNLDKLEEKDDIYIYYKGLKYEYKLAYAYEIKQTGKAEIIRNDKKSTITLITCKRNAYDFQNVYIGYLNKIEE